MGCKQISETFSPLLLQHKKINKLSNCSLQDIPQILPLTAVSRNNAYPKQIMLPSSPLQDSWAHRVLGVEFKPFLNTLREYDRVKARFKGCCTSSLSIDHVFAFLAPSSN